MAEPLSKEERERAWWEAWWAEDYSWAGLAGKPVGKNGETIHGGLRGERTLQDYWRRDPASGAIRDDLTLRASGELVDGPDGRPWHIVHVPISWWDGSPAKSTWDETSLAWQEALIFARLAEAQETRTDEWCDTEAPDGRAQFAGAILRSLPAMAEDSESALHIVCDRARFPAWDAREQTFGTGARFVNASFAEDVRFDNGSLEGYIRFDSASFSGTARFDNASFARYARFDCASFAEHASFHRVVFARDTSFDNATFAENASFVRASFGGFASFDYTAFARDAAFDEAQFAGYASFNGASFDGIVSFDNALFKRDVSFAMAAFARESRFDSTSFAAGASFNGASFVGDASFYTASFFGDVGFGSGQFRGIAVFERCKFLGSASFTAREFLEFVFFDEAIFRGLMAFDTAVFEKAAFFKKIQWPRSARDRGAAFDLALFKGPAVFTGSGFQAFAAFGEAAFERRLRLDEASEMGAMQTFRRERHDATEAAHRDVAAELTDRADAQQARRALAVRWRANQLFHRMLNRRHHPNPGAYWRKAAWAWTRLTIAVWLAPQTDPRLAREVGQKVREARTRRRRELERGCRIVKQAMEKSSNKMREQMCYRFEIAARRSQHDIPPWEWAFSWLYALASDYGASMIRPIVVALGVWMPGFAALYWGLARLLAHWEHPQGPPVKDGAWQALAFSASRVFPFGFWSGGSAPASWLDMLLARGGAGGDWLSAFLSHGQGWSFAIRLIATVESIGALTLLFLTGLALRRRFQIN